MEIFVEHQHWIASVLLQEVIHLPDLYVGEKSQNIVKAVSATSISQYLAIISISTDCKRKICHLWPKWSAGNLPAASFIQEIEILVDKFSMLAKPPSEMDVAPWCYNWIGWKSLGRVWVKKHHTVLIANFLLQTRVLARFSCKRMWKHLLSDRLPAMHLERSKHFLSLPLLGFLASEAWSF